jgi:hypothetical protein
VNGDDSINDETSAASMGPVTLDVESARRGGWTEAQIRRAWAVLESVSSAEGELARLNNPGLYRYDEALGAWEFTG